MSGSDMPFGQNAKVLEKIDSEVNWVRIGKMYAVGFSVFVASLFIIIVAIQLALIIV